MGLSGKEFEGDEGAVVRRETRPKREKQERLMRQYKKSTTLSASSSLDFMRQMPKYLFLMDPSDAVLAQCASAFKSSTGQSQKQTTSG
jgi:hypothetical protein